MNKVGRNDPCPCGSGKKYKKCCGNNNVVSMHKLIEQDMRDLQKQIVSYTFENHHNEFTGLLDQYVLEADMPEEVFELFTMFIGNWIIFSVPFKDGRTAIASFIEENIDSVTRPSLKEALSQWENGTVVISKVQQIISPNEIIIQPLYREDLLTVTNVEQEKRNLEEDTLLIGLLVPLGDKYTFFTTFINIEPEESDEIEDLIVDLFYESGESDFQTYVTKHFPEVLEELIFEAFESDIGLDMLDELDELDFEEISWHSPEYSSIAERFKLAMEKEGIDETFINLGIVMWYAYCEFRRPNIENPMLYIATLHYFLIKKLGIHDESMTQRDLAEMYHVSESSLLQKYRDFDDVLDNDLETDLPDYYSNDETDSNPFRPSFLTEQKLREVERKLEGKNFESEEEMMDFMNEIMNDDEDFDEPLSAKEQAQELLFRAYDAKGSQKIKLVNKALRLYPDSPDAYNILGVEAWIRGQISKAKSLFEKGIEVGKKDLGETFFKENIGHFWGITSTRPFMRVKREYAQLLLETGEIDEAIEQYEELLELNPTDNQGVRYDLFTAYIKKGNLKQAKQLLDEYDEPTANGSYNRLFIELIEHGKTEKAVQLFQSAKEKNAHVLPYLLNKKRIPNREPLAYQLGSEEEAVIYASDHAPLWREKKDALKQLKELANTK